MSETIEQNLRFMFSWADAVLEKDWRSVLGPLVFPGDREALEDIVKRYLGLRRAAPGWRPRRDDFNNHRAIPQADLTALIADAQRLDRGEQNAEKSSPGRPRKAEGFQAECEECGGIYTAKRRTSRFCGGACREAARRTRKRDAIPA